MNHHDFALDVVWTMEQEAAEAGETLEVSEDFATALTDYDESTEELFAGVLS